MKYAFTFIVMLATLLGSTMIMGQTSDCQKKCTDAFIKCSGTCASSADASCGAKCFKERDACTTNCIAEKAKPGPVDKEKKADADKKADTEKNVKPDTDDDDGDIEVEEDLDDDADIEDENDIEDDSGTIDEPEDMENGPDGQDSTDINEEDL